MRCTKQIRKKVSSANLTNAWVLLDKINFAGEENELIVTFEIILVQSIELWNFFFRFCFLIKRPLFSWNFFFRFSCQDTQNYVKCPEKWFRKNFRMDDGVCEYVCVYACILKLRNIKASVSQELFGRSTWNLVCTWSKGSPIFDIIFIKTDSWIGVFFFNFRNRSSCGKFQTIEINNFL